MHLQAEHVKQHACSDNHKLAEQAWLRPDEPVCLALQASYSDDRFLAGVVPQPADWLRSWRWTREGDSWASAERHAQTEQWVDQLRWYGAHIECAIDFVTRGYATWLAGASLRDSRVSTGYLP